MLLFLFSCVMPMLDTSDDMLAQDDEHYSLEVGKVDRSLKSSVRLVIKYDAVEAGHASGNYFKYGRNKFIITAAHVVDGGEVWIKDGLDIVKSETLWVDKERDIAIIRPMGELSETRPIKFRINRDNNKVGSIIRYAGYPSHLGKMVLLGMVAKQTEKKVILQSWALPGSSGSVIFDENGKALGVLSAVAVEMNPFVGIPEIQENIVYAGRLDFITRKFLKEILGGN